MSDITIWHNPRCSKSRQALALLEERGVRPTVRRYLDDAPSVAEIEAALALLGLKAIDLVRTKEAAFKEQGLSADMAEEVLIAAMARTPKLIERPIVFTETRARLGRPPEAVLDLL